MKNKLVLIIIIVVVLIGGGVGAYFIFFSGDGEEDKPTPPEIFEYEVGKTMTYLAKSKDAKNKKQVYVQFSPVIFYRDEETLEVLTSKRTLIQGEIEKYFNTKTLETVTKMRGVNVEDDKDRIEIELEELVADMIGDMGINVVRVSLLGFVIN